MSDTRTRRVGTIATRALPMQGTPGARAAAMTDGLHLFLPDDGAARATHWLIDADAGVVGERATLQFTLTDVSAHGELLLAAGDDDSDALVLAAIDASGAEHWRVLLHGAAPLTLAPSVLAWCDVAGDKVSPVHRFALAGATQRLDTVMTAGGPVVARLAGFPPRLMLLHLQGDAIGAQREIADLGSAPVALAGENDHVVLAGCVPGGVLARRYDAALQPLGPSTRWSVAGAVDRLIGHGGAEAVFVATRWHGKPAARVAQSLVLAVVDAFDVPVPIGFVEAGGWIGERFVLVHGDIDLAATVCTFAAPDG